MQSTETRPPFHVKDMARAAWKNVYGAKAPLWLSWFIVMCASLGVTLVVSIILFTLKAMFSIAANAEPLWFKAFGNILSIILDITILWPLFAGLMLIVLRRVQRKSMDVENMFAFFNWQYIWRIGLTLILKYAIFILGALVLGFLGALCESTTGVISALWGIVTVIGILGYVYLLAGLFFVMPILVDHGKTLAPHRVLLFSLQHVNKHWFRTLLCIICLGLGGMLGALTLLIGYIWILPWSLNFVGEQYYRLFGFALQDPISVKEH